MWIMYALGSAVTASLVAIFGKIGVREVDPMIATIIRGVMMACALILGGFVFRKYETFDVATVSSRTLGFIFLSALAGSASWLLYFLALREGPASAVSVIDKSSVVLVILFAALFLGETLTWRSGLGIVFTVLGSLLILFK